MAINTLSPASVQKNSLMLYPAGSATSDYGILVYDNSNTNVATKIENVRFHLLVPDTEDVKVSLYTKNPASQYFAIAENIPLKDRLEAVLGRFGAGWVQGAKIVDFLCIFSMFFEQPTGHLGRSCGLLGASWGDLGASWAELGPIWAPKKVQKGGRKGPKRYQKRDQNAINF